MHSALGGGHVRSRSTEAEHSGVEVVPPEETPGVLEIEVDSGQVLHVFTPASSDYWVRTPCPVTAVSKATSRSPSIPVSG